MIAKKEFDIIKKDRWEAPSKGDDPVKILTMPNIPKALHNLCPRTVNPRQWNALRKACYLAAGNKCEVCGESQYGHHAHELFDIDYTEQTSTFKRAVCLCPRHHICPGVHTGRALTLFKRGDVYMTKKSILEGLEDIFARIKAYNDNRKEDEEELRLFFTIVDYCKNSQLGPEVRELIKRYDIKFYKMSIPEENDWNKWHMVYNGRPYYSKFKSFEDWQKQMAEKPYQGTRQRSKEEQDMDDWFYNYDKK